MVDDGGLGAPLGAANTLVGKAIDFFGKPNLDFKPLQKYQVSIQMKIGKDSETLEGNIWTLPIHAKGRRYRIFPTKPARQCSAGINVIHEQTSILGNELNLRWRIGEQGSAFPNDCRYGDSLDDARPRREQIIEYLPFCYLGELSERTSLSKDLLRGTFAELLLFFTFSESRDAYIVTHVFDEAQIMHTTLKTNQFYDINITFSTGIERRRSQFMDKNFGLRINGWDDVQFGKK